jgi:putative membrane protein
MRMRHDKIFDVAVAAFAIVGVGDPTAALAHSTAGSGLVPGWRLEPWVLAGLVTASFWYGLGLRRMEREQAPIVGTSAMVAFCGGIAVLVTALVSPIDTLGGELFSVHMVQHLLLMLAAPPLLVYSRPAIVFLWAFPSRQRKQIGRLWIRVGLAAAYDVLMHPALVWMAFTGSFVLWHIPATYQWALLDRVTHTFEHFCFFVTSLAFWTLVIEPSGRRRLDYGPTLIFVVTTAVLSGLPGALMIFASRPLYPAHAEGVVHWGLTLIRDQQLAGLLMWIPAGFMYVAAVAWLFVKWLEEAERRAFKGYRTAAQAVLPVVCASIIALAGSFADARGQDATPSAAMGNARQGAALITHYGCGGCHTIPGITGAQGLVGPPLTAMGRRIFIAGVLRNSPENMMAYLEDPQRFVPGNAMPNMGITRQDAQDIMAYLYTLR